MGYQTYNFRYLVLWLTIFYKHRFSSAVIYRSQEVEVPAPFVASFSSRGPNPGSERILKACYRKLKKKDPRRLISINP